MQKKDGLKRAQKEKRAPGQKKCRRCTAGHPIYEDEYIKRGIQMGRNTLGSLLVLCLTLALILALALDHRRRDIRATVNAPHVGCQPDFLDHPGALWAIHHQRLEELRGEPRLVVEPEPLDVAREQGTHESGDEDALHRRHAVHGQVGGGRLRGEQTGDRGVGRVLVLGLNASTPRSPRRGDGEHRRDGLGGLVGSLAVDGVGDKGVRRERRCAVGVLGDEVDLLVVVGIGVVDDDGVGLVARGGRGWAIRRWDGLGGPT